jgi:hypothetical protein
LTNTLKASGGQAAGFLVNTGKRQTIKMKKPNEKEMYAAQGLTEPVVYHKYAGRNVSWKLSTEEKESWRNLAGENWDDTVVESLEFFGNGKKLYYVTNRYDKNATLKSKTIFTR